MRCGRRDASRPRPQRSRRRQAIAGAARAARTGEPSRPLERTHARQYRRSVRRCKRNRPARLHGQTALVTAAHSRHLTYVAKRLETRMVRTVWLAGSAFLLSVAVGPARAADDTAE